MLEKLNKSFSKIEIAAIVGLMALVLCIPMAKRIIGDEIRGLMLYSDSTGKTSALPVSSDVDLTANSDTQISTQRAIKAYVDAHAGGNLVVVGTAPVSVNTVSDTATVSLDYTPVPNTLTINGLALDTDRTISTQGGVASNYLFCEDVIFAGTTPVWHELEKQSDGGIAGSHTATTTSYTELDRYVTAALNTATIPGGMWSFELFCNMSGASGQIQALIYRVNSAGAIVGTVMGTAQSAAFTNTTVAPILASTYVSDTSGWSATDRIGVVLQGKRIGGASTMTFHHNQASGYVSNVSTPLTLLHNQLNGLNAGDYQHLTAAEKTTLDGATNNNTASTIVKRDGSGNFSAGTITASLTGTASGNLTSANIADTARNNAGLTAWQSTDTTISPSVAQVERALTDCAIRLADRASAFDASKSGLLLQAYYATGEGGIDSYTKLMLHYDNNLTDVSASPKTVTGAGVTFDASTKKFGTHAAIFDGTNMPAVAYSTDLEVGSGDFTVDFWLYPTSTSRAALISFSSDCHLALGISDYYARSINIWASSNGSSWNILNADAGGNGIGTVNKVNLNAWNHIAWVRYGNQWMTYINGVRDLNVTASGTVVTRTDTYMYIGRWANPSINLSGAKMDEFRFSKGVARWTGASFDVPVVAYNADNTADYRLSTSKASDFATAATTVNGHALSANVTVSASDLTTGNLPAAQLPTGGNWTLSTNLNVDSPALSYPTLSIDKTNRRAGLGTDAPGSTLDVHGFSSFGDGAPAIKIKKLTGTTGANEGDETSVAHGLTGAKIISLTALVAYAANSGVAPGHQFAAEFQYDLIHNATNCVIRLHPTNSGSIKSKAFVITIIYEE